jgi:ABC-type bacteriocin/lantibiotic exporter with double-glycine peptidase domain
MHHRTDFSCDFIANNPEILLLDEATSALDHKTEEKIIQTILRLCRDEKKTIIFVTHRRSAIQHADRVVEIQEGILINA